MRIINTLERHLYHFIYRKHIFSDVVDKVFVSEKYFLFGFMGVFMGHLQRYIPVCTVLHITYDSLGCFDVIFFLNTSITSIFTWINGFSYHHKKNAHVWSFCCLYVSVSTHIECEMNQMRLKFACSIITSIQRHVLKCRLYFSKFHFLSLTQIVTRIFMSDTETDMKNIWKLSLSHLLQFVSLVYFQSRITDPISKNR